MQARTLLRSRASRVLVALTGAVLACNLTPSAPPTMAPEPSSSPEPALLSSPTAAIEPTPIEPPTAEPVLAPTSPPGWLTYRNEMLGYEFDYPPEAELIAVGVTGYPTDELPPGLEPGQYIPTLEATYPEALCAGIEFGTAYLYLGAPDDLGASTRPPVAAAGWASMSCGRPRSSSSSAASRPRPPAIKVTAWRMAHSSSNSRLPARVRSAPTMEGTGSGRG